MIRFVVLVLTMLCAAGCDSTAQIPDGGPALPSQDAGAEPDAGKDAGLDAGTNAPFDAGATFWVPRPVQLPLTEGDVLRLGTGTSVDLMSALLVRGAGRAQLFYESWNEEFTESWLMRADSFDDGLSFTPPGRVSFDAGALEHAPSVVGEHLYVGGASSLAQRPGYVRVSFSQDGAARIEPVGLPSAVASVLSWPRFCASADGGVAVAFRDGASVPAVSFSSDGVTFASSHTPSGSSSAAMVAAEFFAGGRIALTHQAPEGAASMVSRVRTSADALSWSQAERVTDASPNVHDTFPFRRADGDLDLYYIYPAGGRGFSLFRRRLTASGALGIEQRVTADSLGDPSKPTAHRLPNGQILLCFADITARGPQGWPTAQQLVVTILASDAP